MSAELVQIVNVSTYTKPKEGALGANTFTQ